MPNTIIIKNSSTVSDVPTAGQLEQGELAINLLDEKLYSKNSSDLIFEIGGGGSPFATPLIVLGSADGAPPQAVTNVLQFFDSDESDLLGEVGFVGSPSTNLQIYNRNHGGKILISAEDAVGTPRVILDSDPDNVTILRADTNIELQYAAGTQRMIHGNASTDQVTIYYNDADVVRTLSEALGGLEISQNYTGGTAGYDRVQTDVDFTRKLGGIHEFQTGVGGGNPGAGHFGFDSATLGSITLMKIDDEDIYGIHDQGSTLSELAAGDLLYMRAEATDAFLIMVVDGAASDQTGFWHVPVSYVAGALPASTDRMSMMVQWMSQAGSGSIGGSITDNQIAVGATTADDIEGSSSLTWDGTDFNIAGDLTADQITGELDGLGLYLSHSTGGEILTIHSTGGDEVDFGFTNVTQVNFDGGGKYDFSNDTVQSVGELYLTEQASSAGNISNQFQLWARNSSPNILFGKTGDGDERPIGYNSMPVATISASQNMLLAEVGYMLHKSSGVAITLTCAQDTNTWDGATWAVHNDDTEDLTIAAGASVTVYWLEAGVAPAAGSVTVKQGGIVTVYKLSNTEFWVWGAKDQATGISDVVEDTTPQLGGDLQSNGSDIDMADNDSIYFGAGNDGRIYSNGTDLYIDLAVGADFRLRGGAGSAESMITAFPNSFVQISYDGVVKFSTTSTGVNIVGTLTADGLDIDDNHHLYLGTSDDVDMYFNATDFYIDLIDGADFRVRGGTGETEPMIEGYANSAVWLYHNGGLEFRTQQHEAASVTSGAEVFDHAGTMRDVGFNHVKEIAITGTIELSNLHAGMILRKADGGTYDIDMAASTTEFPVGSMCTVINHGTGGSLTIDNDLETMYVLDGGGTVSANTGFVLAVGGVVTIWRQGTSVYYVWGAGIP